MVIFQVFAIQGVTAKLIMAAAIKTTNIIFLHFFMSISSLIFEFMFYLGILETTIIRFLPQPRRIIFTMPSEISGKIISRTIIRHIIRTKGREPIKMSVTVIL